jgi:hypothetical protein
LKIFAPKDYAANRGTPIAAYNALFESISAGQREARRQAADAPVFVDPKDELVSYKGLCALGEAPGSGLWTLVSTPKTLRKGRRDYHHLIIDEASLGSARWSDVVSHTKQFVVDMLER